LSGPAAGRDESGLLRHGSLLMAGTLVGAVCNAGFHMVVGREQVLPNAEYGSLVAMLGIILVASTPMLALQNTLAHFTSKLLQDGRREEVMDLFLHWVQLFAAVSLALVAGAVVFRAPLAAFWGGVDPRLIVLTFAVLAATLWMSLFYGLMQGVQSFGWLAFAPQAWGATRLALGAAFTLLISATALAAVAAQGVGVAVVLALGLWAVARLRLPRAAVAARRPRGTYRYLGAAFFCLGGFAMLMNLDTAMAKHYFDAETAGLVAKAATIARTAVFLPVPIATALFPKVTTTGELTDASWRLLGRALAFAGLLITGAVAICLVFPQLPWTILYGRWPAEVAAPAAALTRAMALAMAPLALAYLLLNFEMAQRRFAWCLALVPAGLAYVAGVAGFHDHPLQIAAVLGTLNLIVALLLLAGILVQRRRG
jgi:O-antigen/teichoic acid export membrane protein